MKHKNGKVSFLERYRTEITLGYYPSFCSYSRFGEDLSCTADDGNCFLVYVPLARILISIRSGGEADSCTVQWLMMNPCVDSRPFENKFLTGWLSSRSGFLVDSSLKCAYMCFNFVRPTRVNTDAHHPRSSRGPRNRRQRLGRRVPGQQQAHRVVVSSTRVRPSLLTDE